MYCEQRKREFTSRNPVKPIIAIFNAIIENNMPQKYTGYDVTSSYFQLKMLNNPVNAQQALSRLTSSLLDMSPFHDLRGLFLRRLPSTVPCSMIFGSVSWRQTWPNLDNLRRLTVKVPDVRRECWSVVIHIRSFCVHCIQRKWFKIPVELPPHSVFAKSNKHTDFAARQSDSF